jgi:hypothetical protein
MTDIETALRAILDEHLHPDRDADDWMIVVGKDEAVMALAAVVQGMLEGKSERCGESETTKSLGMAPGRTRGCGRDIPNHRDVFRCRDCAVPFHKQCLTLHCEDDPIEETDVLQATLAEQAQEIARLRELYTEMVNQFALYFTKDGVEMVGTGGLSDLETAFMFFDLPDPCKLGEFRAALRTTPEAKG